MNKDDFGEIYGLDRMYEAENLIGTPCVFSDDYERIKNNPDELSVAELEEVDMFGFIVEDDSYHYKFIREVRPFIYIPFDKVDEFMAEFGDKFIHKAASSNFYWLKPAGFDRLNNKIYIPTEGWLSLFDLALKWVDGKGRRCGMKRLK